MRWLLIKYRVWLWLWSATYGTPVYSWVYDRMLDCENELIRAEREVTRNAAAIQKLKMGD